MLYLALGDSISIDYYTGVDGGGAASQLAKLLRADELIDLTEDGRTTEGVLETLGELRSTPHLITLTAGGNDFLLAAWWGAGPRTAGGRAALVTRPLDNLAAICDRLAALACPVILNTIYDPTDGDDSFGQMFGLAASHRLAFYELNDGIRALARRYGFLLADLHALFAGHGLQSNDCWIVNRIEPNLAGATAIARHWHELVQGTTPR